VRRNGKTFVGGRWVSDKEILGSQQRHEVYGALRDFRAGTRISVLKPKAKKGIEMVLEDAGGGEANRRVPVIDQVWRPLKGKSPLGKLDLMGAPHYRSLFSLISPGKWKQYEVSSAKLIDGRLMLQLQEVQW
jgi:hypothetical protein